MTTETAHIFKAWYCAAFSSEIVDKPLGRTLLDRPLVMYRAQDGKAVALSDVCPHRFAPLHQGKLVDDALACPYHGLVFDRHGHCVHNPHGSGRIASQCAVDSYCVVERDGVAWIWMDKADTADFSSIPDLNLFAGEEGRVSGYSLTPAEYRLVIDNLLDLNHAPYLHSGTLSPVGATRETRSERGASSAASHYLMRSVSTPASQKVWFTKPKGDYHVSMEWRAPSTLLQTISMTEEGRPPEEGAMTRGVHLLTPCDATSTHYFWIMTRNRLRDNPEAGEHLKRIINNAFANEDGPMLEACQANMRGRAFNDLHPIFLEIDVAAIHARTVLARMMSKQKETSEKTI